MMGETFIDLVLHGMKRLRAAVSDLWKRYTPPAGAGGSKARTDPR